MKPSSATKKIKKPGNHHNIVFSSQNSVGSKLETNRKYFTGGHEAKPISLPDDRTENE